jgi:hypothetical protein
VELTYDGLIIASGARPRRLNGVRTLRTVDDPLALRADLASGHEHVLVIGGGFIGREVAFTALQLGRKATLVGSSPYPMFRKRRAGWPRAMSAMGPSSSPTAGSPSWRADRYDSATAATSPPTTKRGSRQEALKRIASPAAFTRGGVLVGAVAVNSPKDLIQLKRAISARAEV